VSEVYEKAMQAIDEFMCALGAVLDVVYPPRDPSDLAAGNHHD